MQEFNLIKLKYSKGLSLIELMIALVLSLIVLLSAAKGLSAISTTSMEQTAQNSAQEVATLTFNHLDSSIKSIASTPCESIASLSSINWGNGSIAPFGTATTANWISMGLVPTAQPSPDPTGNGDLIPPSDTFTYYLTDERASITANTTLAGNTPITLTNVLPNTANNVGATATFMMSDCDSADVFNATISFNGFGQLVLTPVAPTTLSQVYNTIDSSIAMVNQIQLSIQFDPTINDWVLQERIGTGLGSPITAPPTTILSNLSLVTGVEAMSLLWGLDNTGNDNIVDVFQNSNQLNSNPANIANIESVNIYLLVKPQGKNNRNLSRSNTISVLFPNGGTASQFTATNPVNLTTWPFTDRDLRRTFSKTIKLRNF